MHGFREILRRCFKIAIFMSYGIEGEKRNVENSVFNATQAAFVSENLEYKN
jgi:hypothetical protein